MGCSQYSLSSLLILLVRYISTVNINVWYALTPPHKIYKQGCQHFASKESENFAKCLPYAFMQAISRPRHRRSQLGGNTFSFLSRVTEIFCKIETKFLNSRVLAGGFVIECAKKFFVLRIYKKVVEESAV